MVKLGEFFLEDRAARFEPTVDLRQDIAERETFQPFREAGQYAHERAVKPASDHNVSVRLSFTKTPLGSRTGWAQVGVSATR